MLRNGVNSVKDICHHQGADTLALNICLHTQISQVNRWKRRSIFGVVVRASFQRLSAFTTKLHCIVGNGSVGAILVDGKNPDFCSLHIFGRVIFEPPVENIDPTIEVTSRSSFFEILNFQQDDAKRRLFAAAS